MPVEGLPRDEETRPPRLSSRSALEEYALALVGALELATQTGGRQAFDCLFDRGFDRLYAWSYRLVGRNSKRAQELTLEILLSAARALARRATELADERAQKR